MVNRKIYKKISLFLIIVLLMSIFYPFSTAQAQITNYYTYEREVESFDNNVTDAVVSCMQDAILKSLLGAAGGVISDYLGDAMGGIIGGIMSGDLSGILDSGLGSLFGGGVLGIGGTVPVNESKLQSINQKIKGDTGAQTAKEVGVGGSSLDSIAFCLANKAIDGIVVGTNNWVRKGFGGNPVFINNPGRYFGNIAEYELQKLLGDLTDDLICVNVNVNSLKNNIFRNYYRQTNTRIPKCALGTIDIDIDAFSRGKLSVSGGWESWLAYTSDPSSNQMGAQFLLEKSLYENTVQSQETAKTELDWNNGYISLRDDSGNITTTGNMIQAQVESRLNAPINRLTFADEFDEIMNNLINSFLGSVISDFGG